MMKLDYAVLPLEIWSDILQDEGLTPEEVAAIRCTVDCDTGSYLMSMAQIANGYYHSDFGQDEATGDGLSWREGEGGRLLNEDMSNGTIALGNGWTHIYA